MRPPNSQTGRLGLFVLFALALWVAYPAAAQETPASDETAPAAPPHDATPIDAEPRSLPLEVEPKVFYVRDRDGHLQAIPSIGYEELMEWWKQQRQLAAANQRPAYSIEQISITGLARSTSAELVARFKIAVHETGWVSVPLRCNEAVLREPASYDGPGEHVLKVDPQTDGHIVWLRGEADQRHELSLKLVAPLEQLGPQTRLPLSLPRATTAEMQLQVPLAQAAATVSEGSVLDAIRPIAGGKSELRVLGLGDEFEVSWHPSDSNIASLPTILEATSTQLVRLNGRSANTDVKLTVRSLGSEFDHFQVRLPPGASYVGTPEPGLSLVAVDATSSDGKLYEVRLEKKTLGPVELRLVTERSHDATQDEKPLELAGFEVQGAVRQWGTIAVQVEGNWQVVWGETDHVRAVDDVATSGDRDELTAGFEYFVQPYSLMARVVPQRTKIRIEPAYVLHVSREDVRLKARLKTIIRGAKVRSLTIDLPGWEVDSVGPNSLVNVDAAIAGVDDVLTLPLMQATSGEVELVFEARQPLELDAGHVKFDLPVPQGELLPADVIIVSDDAIELLPRLEELRHLVPQSTRPPVDMPKRQQEPLYYRTSGDAARVVADLRVHQQQITSSLATTIRLRDNETLVEETLAFQVAYQPTDRFTLVVPGAIRPERMTILYEGIRLSPIVLSTSDSQETGHALVRVDLPTPAIGRCELQISYARRHARPPTQASTLMSIPLVVPSEVTLSDNQVRVEAEGNLVASYPQGPWTAEGGVHSTGGSASADASQALLLTAPRALSELTLAVSSRQAASETVATVERAVLETRITERVRKDRARFRLLSERPRVEINFPEGFDPRTLIVLINGVRVTPEAVVKRVVTLPLDNRRQDHLLDLRYMFAARPPRGAISFRPPEIPSARWVQQLYWQLLVPDGEHVIVGPAGYTEETTWHWRGYLWQRQPALDDAELDRWVSAGTWDPLVELERQPATSSSIHQYLFSSVGPIEPLTVYTMSRARLVLLASLPILILGLAMIYFPAVRHPAALLVLSLAVFGAGMAVPHLAILLAQASLLGAVLVILAAVLAYFTPSPQPIPPASPRGSSIAMVERSVTELYHRAPLGGSHPASTATNPLVPSVPEPDA